MKYNNYFSNLPVPLKDDELYDLFNKAHNGDMMARNIIIEHNMRFVLHIAYKFNNTPYDIDELISSGLLGLTKAVDTFDLERGLKFSTYAARCIYNEILMFIRNEKKHLNEMSLNKSLGNDKDGNELIIEDVLVDESVDFVRDYEVCDTNRIIREVINKLPDRDRDVIFLFFGFESEKEYTQEEIANKFNISQSYVSRLIKKTLKEIKEELIRLKVIAKISENRFKNKEEKKMPRMMKSIYEYFSKYSKEEINEVISNLSDKEKELLHDRYGDDLEHPCKTDNFDKNKAAKLYGSLIPRIKTKLKNNKIKSLELDNTIKDKASLKLTNNAHNKKGEPLQVEESITKDDYIKILEMMKNLKFSDMLNELEVKDAIIICLRLGYVDNKFFSTKSIADFLGVEEEEVIETTKKVLLLDLFGKVIEQNSQNMISLIQEYKSGDDNDIYINSTYRCNSRYAYNYNF